jgi:hypothetical protein
MAMASQRVWQLVEVVVHLSLGKSHHQKQLLLLLPLSWEGTQQWVKNKIARKHSILWPTKIKILCSNCTLSIIISGYFSASSQIN